MNDNRLRVRAELEASAARILAERPVRIAKLARIVPAARGERGHVSSWTLLRWITRGKDGVRLDGMKMAGSGWYSSEAALVRFFAALTERELSGRVEVRSPCEMERRAAAAGKELDKLRRGG